MIQANELRIGNWYNNGYGIYKLGTSDFMDHLNEAQVNDGEIELVNPIPLTPEILESCGFVLGAIIEIRIEQGEYLSRKIILDGYYNDGIKYLHQLQNLYFALTGTELEINL